MGITEAAPPRARHRRVAGASLEKKTGLPVDIVKAALSAGGAARGGAEMMCGKPITFVNPGSGVEGRMAGR